MEERGKFRFRAPSEAEGVPPGHQILLASRRIVLEEGAFVGAPRENRPTGRGTFPLLVQLRGAAGRAARERVARAGARVVGAVPHRALLTECPLSACAAVSRLEGVRGAVELAPGDKLAPFLADAAGRFSGRVEVRISPLAEDGAGEVAGEVEALGGEVLSRGGGGGGGPVEAAVELSDLARLAAAGAVRWIEPLTRQRALTDLAHGPGMLDTRPLRDDWGLDGAGERVAHSDSGIDSGRPESLHPDLRRRVRKIVPLDPRSDGSDANGHGTHTAGLIAGDGTASRGRFRGSAPGADLYCYTVYTDPEGYLYGLPGDLGELMLPGYQEGARVHSASWGDDAPGPYDTLCRTLDAFVWGHPDFLPVFAAGNSGRDNERPRGVVDPGSVLSPAAAKNCVAVGAAESGRPPGGGGYTSLHWSGFGFFYEPIASDFVSSSTNEMRGMAATSSRGPAGDGRIKPDIAAPGTDVVSTRAYDRRGGGGPAGWETYYCFMTGTSMAAPLIAGGAALMRQYAAGRAGLANPSAALVKAMLIGGARSIAPGQYGEGAFREIPEISPNNAEGWGLADFTESVYPEGRNLLLEDRLEIPQGATNRTSVVVARPGRTLCATLCWVDPPALENAARCLVNDYDLEAVAPDGRVLHANGGGGPDRLNTAERILLPDAAAGAYEFRVIASDCPYGPDEGGAVALCIAGGFEKQPELFHRPRPAVPAGGDGTLAVEFLAHSLDPLTNGPDAAVVRYAFGTRDGATGGWARAAAARLSNSCYRAVIGGFPPGAFCHYRIDVAGTNGTRVLSPFYATRNGEPVALAVFGHPRAYGFPDPMYGTNEMTIGESAALSAPETVRTGPGSRVRCQGFVGEGDVPLFGTEANVETPPLAQPSSVTWIWKDQYTLTEQLKLLSGGVSQGIWPIRKTWHDAGAAAATLAVPLVEWLEEKDGALLPFAFSGWRLSPGGARSGAPALDGIAMNAPTTATAEYRPIDEDSGTDGIPDWWALRFFGSAADVPAADDPDGDGWDNASEALDGTDPRDPASRPEPPRVTLHPIAPAFRSDYPPWTAAADVRDNFLVEEVRLLWRERGEEQWRETPMRPVSGDRYEAALTPPSMGRERVEYRVEAFDRAAAADPALAAVSESAYVVGEYERPFVAAGPDTLRDLRFHRWLSETGLAFRVENVAGPDAVWTACVSSASIALDPGEWQGDGWVRTANRTETGGPVWYCGDPAARLYANQTRARLTTGPFRVPAPYAVLSVRHWMQGESEDAARAWDGGLVEISAAAGEGEEPGGEGGEDNAGGGGASWAPLEPSGGYPMRIIENPDSTLPAGTPCFSGDGLSWRTSHFPLNGYAGRVVRIRFTFGSDLLVVREGWYIGEARVSAFGTPPAWALPETPAGGTLPAGAAADARFRITSEGLAPHRPETSLLAVFFPSADPRFQTAIPILRRLGSLLALSADGPGALTADKTFLCAPDNNPTVCARAAPHHFVRALSAAGGANFSLSTNAPSLSLPLRDVRSDTLVHASFAPRLAARGVPEPWLARNGFTGDWDAACESDPDGDLLPTWKEYYAGTCPTNPLSTLRILEFGGGRLTWQGGAGRTQYVERAEALPGPWQTVRTNLPPTPLTNTVPVDTSAPRAFYRIRVPAPTEQP